MPASERPPRDHSAATTRRQRYRHHARRNDYKQVGISSLNLAGLIRFGGCRGRRLHPCSPRLCHAQRRVTRGRGFGTNTAPYLRCPPGHVVAKLPTPRPRASFHGPCWPSRTVPSQSPWVSTTWGRSPGPSPGTAGRPPPPTNGESAEHLECPDLLMGELQPRRRDLLVVHEAGVPGGPPT
jgi:hypothetical protein